MMMKRISICLLGLSLAMSWAGCSQELSEEELKESEEQMKQEEEEMSELLPANI
jgi:PBP1b-binding outer membrane lipoprotein LpoB